MLAAKKKSAAEGRFSPPLRIRIQLWTDIAGQIFVTDQEGVFAAEDRGIGDDDAFRAGKRFHVEA
jgi:hypothetical protein